MAIFWWKIMVLQFLIIAAKSSDELELGDNSELSNENIMLLFKKFLGSISSQQSLEDMNGKGKQIKDFYRTPSFTPLDRKQIFDKIMGNQEIQKLTLEDYPNADSNENINKKRGKTHYVTTLCRFKICNKKKSLDDYDNFYRYMTKTYTPSRF